MPQPGQKPKLQQVSQNSQKSAAPNRDLSANTALIQAMAITVPVVQAGINQSEIAPKNAREEGADVQPTAANQASVPPTRGDSSTAENQFQEQIGIAAIATIEAVPPAAANVQALEPTLARGEQSAATTSAQPQSPQNQDSPVQPQIASTDVKKVTMDPLLGPLLRQVKKLQPVSEVSQKAGAQPIAIEVSNKTVPQKTVRVNAGNVQNISTVVAPTLPAQSYEQIRQNLALKPEKVHTVAGDAKAAAVAPADAKQNATAQQESTQGDSGNDTSAGNLPNDTRDLDKLAVDAMKQQPEDAPEQNVPTDSSQLQSPAIAQSVAATHQDRTENSPIQLQNSNQSAPAQAATGPNWHPADDTTSKGVSTAQLADAASHTEMRISMQTDRLGNIELRAHVSGETVGAAITVEKRDAHSVLAVELPALQQALSEKSLRVDQVALFQGSLNLNDGQAGKDAQQQHATGSQQATKAWSTQNAELPAMSFEYAQTSAFDAAGRLNVHA